MVISDVSRSQAATIYIAAAAAIAAAATALTIAGDANGTTTVQKQRLTQRLAV